MTDSALSPADAAVVERVVKDFGQMVQSASKDFDLEGTRTIASEVICRPLIQPIVALVVAARGQSARERQERLRASGTHWDGCETVHLDCAVEALVAARAEIRTLQEEQAADSFEVLTLRQKVIDAEAQLAARTRERDALMPLARLGAWLLDERNQERYPDGFDVQDMATKFGAIHPVPVTERCGDGCRCEEYDNLPGDCYRETEAVTQARAALRAAGGGDGK